MKQPYAETTVPEKKPTVPAKTPPDLVDLAATLNKIEEVEALIREIKEELRLTREEKK